MVSRTQEEQRRRATRRKITTIGFIVVILLLVTGYNLFQNRHSSEPGNAIFIAFDITGSNIYSDELQSQIQSMEKILANGSPNDVVRIVFYARTKDSDEFMVPPSGRIPKSRYLSKILDAREQFEDQVKATAAQHRIKVNTIPLPKSDGAFSIDTNESHEMLDTKHLDGKFWRLFGEDYGAKALGFGRHSLALGELADMAIKPELKGKHILCIIFTDLQDEKIEATDKKRFKDASAVLRSKGIKNIWIVGLSGTSSSPLELSCRDEGISLLKITTSHSLSWSDANTIR